MFGMTLDLGNLDFPLGFSPIVYNVEGFQKYFEGQNENRMSIQCFLFYHIA